MPLDSHSALDSESVGCAVVTVSDTRTDETDESGHYICQRLETAGHFVSSRQIVPDEPDVVCGHVKALCGQKDIQVVLLTGGTGLAPRDTTYEAIQGLLDKRLDGFGELFRMLSYEEFGAAAMLSRAVAGVHEGVAIFSMPGSRSAVRMAMQKLILPQLRHIAGLLAS